MSVWADPLWLAEAHEWIREWVDRLGMSVTGSIEQPHVRAWSTVLRVPTSSGDVWFKANIPLLAHEAAVVGVLARRRPDLVPALLAVDLERGWMLMADGGVLLRTTIEQERDLRPWLDVLRRYGGLQTDVADCADELVALGAPDHRLATLAGRCEQLLDQMEGLADDQARRFRRLAPRVREMCGQLAGYGIPETIQHNDFHDGQVFVREDSYVFFDWAEACVSHPFSSMATTLEGVISWGVDDVEGSEDVTPFRDAYLESFTLYAARAELEAACATAMRLGWISRALSWYDLACALDAADREEHLGRVELRLNLFAGGLE